ncbi:SulP family inorganic anion transporter [Maribrevibacterium harenarium]|uniref:SulP family inorganic anion transporter n=1 Tax=Maribrevibacterium harenarium TaxID=2589817 RepID=A0A501WGN7_9GAMM|nr:SulP family inorganic anion transporter [Maribrevibacterium harenarium]TPE48749.1 SulP family inorganic anion transporter [Maribrevibacterium harenarium]
MLHHYLPWLSQVNRRTLGADIIAALTCASMAIPQGIAFAAIAGLPPEYGFYSAMVAPVIAVLFGSSWHMVCGPATAISALLFSTLSGSFEPGTAEFISAAISITFLAGVFQLLLGFAKLGNLTNFVSHAVMVGFITGAALLIILSQIKHALTLDLARPEQIGEFVYDLGTHLPDSNLVSLAIAGSTIFVALLCQRLSRRLPSYLIALVAGSLVGFLLGAQDVGVPLVGELSSAIPPLAAVELSLSNIRDLAPGAAVLALIGLMEAASISKAIALKTGQEINTNQEFIGQGLSNMVGSLFSNYMSSGSFTRSALNVEAGAQTPLAVIFTSLFLVAILSLIAPLFSHLPIPAMAGVIILVGIRLIAIKELIHYGQTSRTELIIAAATLVTTLLVSLEFGILVGVGLSLALFLKQTANPNVRVLAPMQTTQGRYFHNIQHFELETCPQVHFIRLDGPVYFGSIDSLARQFNELALSYPEKQHWVILCRGISSMDMQGGELLLKLHHQLARNNQQLHLVVRYLWQLDRLRQFGVIAAVGEEYIYPSKGIAIDKLAHHLSPKVCAVCEKRVFKECDQWRDLAQQRIPIRNNED